MSIVVPLSGVGPGNGSFSATVPWPATLHSIFVQAFVADSAPVHNHSASNGLQLGRN